MFRSTPVLLIFALLCAVPAFGQVPNSSSSAANPAQEPTQSPLRRTDATGAAITLETNEPLFDIATGLNACGYDAGLADSSPVRSVIREQVAANVAASPLAKQAQQALCRYVEEHALADRNRELAQYISLALYLGPAPGIAPVAEETEMPPDALAVINILPLLRTFAEAAELHSIWTKHHADYEAATDKVHDSVTSMILGTNIYLKVPVSSNDGRRFLILVEPMLAPKTPNARVYSTDYIVVTSPTSAGAINMDQIRHLYLHYEIEPLVYARAQSIQRLAPLLKPVQRAPVDFIYKSDVTALVTECLIKAIEARTMDTGFAVPKKPTGNAAKVRAEQARYDEELTAYDKQSGQIRRRQVDLDMHQGWVLTDYFYSEMQSFERAPESLSEVMGQMVYGMDVSRVQHQADQIVFLREGTAEVARRSVRPLSGLMLAEKKMLEGDLQGAEAIAEKALDDPKADHAQAKYVLARVELMQGKPDFALADFEDVLKSATDPRTLAWAHIYLGRLLDTQDPPQRPQALTEYRAALAVQNVQKDAQLAAEKGLKTPFTLPNTAKTTHPAELSPEAIARQQKNSYKPE